MPLSAPPERLISDCALWPQITAGIPASGPRQRAIPEMPQTKLAMASPERSGVGLVIGGGKGELMSKLSSPDRFAVQAFNLRGRKMSARLNFSAKISNTRWTKADLS